MLRSAINGEVRLVTTCLQTPTNQRREGAAFV